MIKDATFVITKWNGDKIEAQCRANVASALNATCAEAVTAAQSLAPRDTGFMANTIEIVETATAQNMSCTWGNVTANYTLWQEIGTARIVGKFFLRGGAERAYSNFEAHLASLGGGVSGKFSSGKKTPQAASQSKKK